MVVGWDVVVLIVVVVLATVVEFKLEVELVETLDVVLSKTLDVELSKIFDVVLSETLDVELVEVPETSVVTSVEFPAAREVVSKLVLFEEGANVVLVVILFAASSSKKLISESINFCIELRSSAVKVWASESPKK